MRYFVVVSGSEEGPYTFAELQAMAAAGVLHVDAALRPEEGGETITAGTLAGLFSAPPPGPGAYEMPPPAPRPSAGRSPWVIALVVVVGLCVVCVPVMGAILFPVFSQARIAAQRTLTLSHAKNIGIAMALYHVENDDRFPPVVSTALADKPYIGKFIKADSDTETVDAILQSLNNRSHTFQGNGVLAGMETFKVEKPELTLLYFDSQDWPGGKRVACFVDSSAKVLVGSDVWNAFEHEKGVMSPLTVQADQ